MFKSTLCHRNGIKSCVSRLPRSAWSTNSTRSVFTVPRLNNKYGIPTSIYSEEGFQVVWNQYQKYLSEKLTYATQGTQLESLLPFQLVLKTSKEHFNSKVFNYASGLHSNHLFVENILPSSTQKPTADSSSSSSSSSSQSLSNNGENSSIVRHLTKKYSMDWNQLQKKIISDSEKKLVGQGYIFIVEDMNKDIDILYTNNYGTPYYRPRQQSFDLNGGALTHKQYTEYYDLKKNVVSGGSNAVGDASGENNKDLKNFQLPLVAINLWDYAYLKDYGSDGRSKYLENVLKNLNWDVINKRLFTH